MITSYLINSIGQVQIINNTQGARNCSFKAVKALNGDLKLDVLQHRNTANGETVDLCSPIEPIILKEGDILFGNFVQIEVAADSVGVAYCMSL